MGPTNTAKPGTPARKPGTPARKPAATKKPAAAKRKPAARKRTTARKPPEPAAPENMGAPAPATLQSVTAPFMQEIRSRGSRGMTSGGATGVEPSIVREGFSMRDLEILLRARAGQAYSVGYDEAHRDATDRHVRMLELERAHATVEVLEFVASALAGIVGELAAVKVRDKRLHAARLGLVEFASGLSKSVADIHARP